MAAFLLSCCWVYHSLALQSGPGLSFSCFSLPNQWQGYLHATRCLASLFPRETETQTQIDRQCVCYTCRCLQRPKESDRSLGVEVTGICELSTVDAGSKPTIEQPASILSHPSISPTLLPHSCLRCSLTVLAICLRLLN